MRQSAAFCPRCERPVPADARFCNHCGAPLKVACPSCRSVNTFGSRYCSVCGQPLAAQAQAAAAPAQTATAKVLEAQPGPQDPPHPDVAVPASPGPAPAPGPAAPGGLRCARCSNVNEPGARFCFSCGLPVDEALRTEETASAAGAPDSRWTRTSTPAGFWSRLVARILDQVILISVLLAIYVLWGVVEPDFFVALESGATTAPAYLVSIAVEATYYILAVGIWGTTIGKRALGLKVVNAEGFKPSMGEATGRYFASILSGMILLIGYLMVAFRDDKRALHDLIAGTWVIHR